MFVSFSASLVRRATTAASAAARAAPAVPPPSSRAGGAAAAPRAAAAAPGARAPGSPAAPAAAAASPPASPAFAALAELQRRTRLAPNSGRVNPKHIHALLDAVAAPADVPAALRAVTLGRSRSRMQARTGDLLVSRVLRTRVAGAAGAGGGAGGDSALDAVVGALRHPKAALPLSSHAAGTLFFAAAAAGDAAALPRLLALVVDAGLRMTPDLTYAIVRAGFATRHVRASVAAYLTRARDIAGASGGAGGGGGGGSGGGSGGAARAGSRADGRALHILAKGLLALPAPAAPLQLKRPREGAEPPADAPAPAGPTPLSADGAELVGHLRAAVAPGAAAGISPGTVDLVRKLLAAVDAALAPPPPPPAAEAATVAAAPSEAPVLADAPAPAASADGAADKAPATAPSSAPAATSGAPPSS